ncbi:MAG: di-heme-cytochrome C peroxidase [Pseudomonadota bacterium]
MINKLISGSYHQTRRHIRLILKIKIVAVLVFIAGLLIWKGYQKWDNDPDRGAIGISNGAFGENYETPKYIDQGWNESDSLWFYNTTQGSNLLPYDFFVVLEQAGSSELLRSDQSIDFFRYLPQKKTFFNPDGLPVGFVKDEYQKKDYVGHTCAACHTSQVNYKGKAVRIDGGPSMADMVGFLAALEKSLESTRDDVQKRERFVKNVLALNNDYSTPEDVIQDLNKWTDSIEVYNTINHSSVKDGYARLDAFGRIYNRVLEHVINKAQLRLALLQIVNAERRHILTPKQVDAVLNGISETIIGGRQFEMVLNRLQSKEGNFPNLSPQDMLRVRNALFNEPSAPVSYPVLWDITHSDYVQWNSVAANAGTAPLGRNAGEVIGVFASLDWTSVEPGFSVSGFISGQSSKRPRIKFKSSIDLPNLSRLESHLQSLTSPRWEDAMQALGAGDPGKIDAEKASRGAMVYHEYCQSCHQVIDRTDWDRRVTVNMSDINVVGTDPAMAKHSVEYKGYTGNFESTYQRTDVGSVIIQNRAPVAQILTAVTIGTVGTPDADMNFISRRVFWLYLLVKSFFDNEIMESVKSGNYLVNTTANPFQSLLSYKARSLNGIWATAPYLHNGSIPNLYSLLLPKKREGDPEEGQYRPESFQVGCRELDIVAVGFQCTGDAGFNFQTLRVGDLNIGHDYGTGRDGKTPLTEQERWDLIEYIKTL